MLSRNITQTFFFNLIQKSIIKLHILPSPSFSPSLPSFLIVNNLFINSGFSFFKYLSRPEQPPILLSLSLSVSLSNSLSLSQNIYQHKNTTTPSTHTHHSICTKESQQKHTHTLSNSNLHQQELANEPNPPLLVNLFLHHFLLIFTPLSFSQTQP